MSVNQKDASYREPIFQYYQKCFNHAIMANEDTVLGEKSIF